MESPKVILFADDDAWLVQPLIDDLMDSGYKVLQADTGSESIKILKKETGITPLNRG